MAEMRICTAVFTVLACALLSACIGGPFVGSRSPSDRLSKLNGMVEDCYCEYTSVDHLNREALHPILQSLVQTPFFRYFKAKLSGDCPFWRSDGLCMLRDCSISECPDEEFPESLKAGGNVGVQRYPSGHFMCREGNSQAMVDRTLDPRAFRGWAVNRDNPWTFDDERDDGDVTYVNLLLNSERFTGYSGPAARSIWEAIYYDNVLVSQEKLCPAESRLLYKLISGFQSSISVHIAADYLLDENENKWGPNLTLLHDRLLKHEDRMRNLYFTFLFVLRAVTKAADYLIDAEYETGNPSEDDQTAKLVLKLVQNERLQAACPRPFDEAKLWEGEDGSGRLLVQLQKQFRNISALMDCVGCERCRLWGKLQILGLGAALEILLSEDLPNAPVLQRNEVIALLNLLGRLSESLISLHDLAPLVKGPSFFGLGYVFKHWSIL